MDFELSATVMTNRNTRPDEPTRNTMDPQCELSVILPFCNERECLPELLERLRASLDPTGLSYELLFIDDGSTDDGVAYLEEAAGRDERIKVLVLSRNFGQHIAATAGIDSARGQMVVWMDADLQERPEDIPRLIDKHREGFDVVYARRRQRRQSRLRAVLSNAYLRFLNRLAKLDVPPERACLRLFSAKVAESLRELPERNRYMAYLIPWTGFRSAEIEVEMDPRRHGETKYSITHLVTLGLTGLTAFSTAPLRVAAIFSGMTIAMCLIGVGFIVYRYLAFGFVVSGWASLVVAMLALHAMEFAVLAVLGEYIGQTYTETKHRPLYICARAVNFKSDAPTARSLARTDALGSTRPAPAERLEFSPV